MKTSINIAFVLMLILTSLAKAQIIELYHPIVVTYKKAVLNDEKVNIGIFDRFKEDTSKMLFEYLKYDSDENALYQYSDKEKAFIKILSLEPDNEKVYKNIKFGIFDEFDLQRKNKALFTAKSPYFYPSHHRIVRSVEIISQTKETLILKINYQDEFEWQYFGILVLHDFKYKSK